MVPFGTDDMLDQTGRFGTVLDDEDVHAGAPGNRGMRFIEPGVME